MKFYLIILIATIFFLHSCKGKNSNSLKKELSISIDTDARAPIRYIMHPILEQQQIINEYRLQKMIDDAKWKMYVLYCDSASSFHTLHFQDEVYSGFTFGELELAISIVEYEEHGFDGEEDIKLSLDFRKSYPNYYEIANTPRPDEICGFYYNIHKKCKPLCLIKYIGRVLPLYSSILYGREGRRLRKKNRILNPMQPEVIYYIRQNAAKINPWFYEQAKKRGVFDSTLYPPDKITKEIEEDKKLNITSIEDCI